MKQLVMYEHRDEPHGMQYVQFESDPTPDWAINVRRVSQDDVDPSVTYDRTMEVKVERLRGRLQELSLEYGRCGVNPFDQVMDIMNELDF